MTDKRSNWSDALKLLPDAGGTIAFGGITMYRRPVAFSVAMAARFLEHGYPRDIRLVAFTAGLESDLLVGMGMVSSVRTCYFGLEAFGFAPYFTSAAGNGKLEVIEESEASLAYGIRAAMAGVGFMPSISWQGTDMLKLRPDVKTIQDPYSGEELTAFPAIHCDLAIVHALEVDPQGNANIGEHQGVDRELALVSEQVIVTTEKIVPSLKRADIIGRFVDAVVEIPNGAWPSSCHPLYPVDGRAVLDYLDTSDPGKLPALIRSWHERYPIATE